MLLEEFLKEFEYEMECRKLSPRTIKTSRNAFKLFINFCNKELDVSELEEVGSMEVKKYLSYLNQLDRSPVYLNGIIKYFRMFFKYAYEEEYIERNFMTRVSWFKEKQTVIKTFSDEEIVQMLSVWNFKSFYNARNKVIVGTLFDTGIRCNELLNIKTIDIKERSILITCGKGNKERYVPISAELKKLLIKYKRIRDQYMKNQASMEYLFISYRGKQLTVEAVERVIRETGKLAGVRKEIRCSPHTIRHTYCKYMLKKGTDIYSASRLMGHSNISTTKIYLRDLQDDELVDNINVSPLGLK